MPHKVATTIKLLPTYGVDHYGTDIFLPLFEQDDNTGAITISNTTITQSTSPGSNFPIDKQDEFISNIDTLQFLHAGNDTEFDHTYTWQPDMSAIVYKLRVQVAFVLNVSARTAGSFDLTQIALLFREQPGNRVIYENTFPVTMAAISAVGNAMFIFDADVVEPFKVFSGNPIDFSFTTTVTTGTGTFQVGIAPIFPYTTPADAKPFARSGITLHIHASLDHADPIFNKDIERVI